MGLVAWSSARAQHLGGDAHVVSTPNNVPAVETAIETTVVPPLTSPSNTVAASQPTDWVSHLAVQTLESFAYRGMMVDCIGVDSAPLIVICGAVDVFGEPVPMPSNAGDQSAANTAGDKPMSGECMQLFDLMMRSIGVARNNFRLCEVSHQKLATNSRSVASLITPQTKAVLLLDGSMTTCGSSSQDSSEAARDSCARLPTSQLPVWRIPHPGLLLSTPSLKRGAWENLKALRQVIALQDNT